VPDRYHVVQEFNKGVYDYIIATDETGGYDETQQAEVQQVEEIPETQPEDTNPEDVATIDGDEEDHLSDIAEGQSLSSRGDNYLISTQMILNSHRKNVNDHLMQQLVHQSHPKTRESQTKYERERKVVANMGCQEVLILSTCPAFSTSIFRQMSLRTLIELAALLGQGGVGCLSAL
jgi:hypothetical protein